MPMGSMGFMSGAHAPIGSTVGSMGSASSASTLGLGTKKRSGASRRRKAKMYDVSGVRCSLSDSFYIYSH